jgi:hypothetical protein
MLDCGALLKEVFGNQLHIQIVITHRGALYRCWVGVCSVRILAEYFLVGFCFKSFACPTEVDGVGYELREVCAVEAEVAYDVFDFT